MRQAGMLCLLVLLSAALLSAQRTNTDPSSPSQTQTPSSQNSTTVNPQSPTTPMGTAPTQSTPAQPSNPSQQGMPNTPDQNSARPPDINGVQSVQPAPTGADQVPVNTEMRAALDTPLSSKTSKGGDRFTSTVTDPVRGSNGAVIIPAGARVEGEVADAEQTNAIPALRGKTQLSLHFRDIVLPNGQTLPLSATLVSVNSTNGKSARKADENQVQSGTQGKEVAKDTGAGTDASAAGLVFGTPLKGLAVGALAGGGYVLSTKDKDINLPAQTGMVIRLDQPLTATGGPITQR